MTADLNLGVDFDALQQEEARANRPTFNLNPVHWKGKLASIGQGSETFSDGREFPRTAFTFENCKFLDVGNAIGVFKDGDTYVLLMQPIDPSKNKRFQQIGKSTLASGMNLEKFLGSEVEVVEIAETYKAANGFDRQSYHWRFIKVGDGAKANGASAPIPEEATVIALQFLAGGQYTKANFAQAFMNSPHANLNTDLSSRIAMGKWVTDMLEQGRVKETTDGVLHT